MAPTTFPDRTTHGPSTDAEGNLSDQSTATGISSPSRASSEKSSPHVTAAPPLTGAAASSVAPDAEKQQPPPTTAAWNAGPPPPNGGLAAWLQVVSVFFIFFNTWGLLNTFGIFQTYYESSESIFQPPGSVSSSNISWIGSIQSFMVLLGGLVSGPLYDRGYLKYLIYVGAFGVVFGHMMLSLVSEFWQALLAQGFVVGLGAGMMFTPGVTVLQSYFSTKIGLATGLAAAGSSFGGVIYPIVFYRLIDRIGYGWSVRVIGFIALATLMVPVVFLKQRTKSGKVRALVDVSAFTDGPYVLFTFGTFVGFIGLYVMLFYLSFFGLDTGATDPAMAFYIVPILNAASMFGRTLPNWLSDKVGPFNILIPGALVCGALTLAMMGVKGLGAIIVVAILFGFFSGVFIALPTVCYIALTKDKSRLGSRIGLGYAFLGLATLIGGPGTGAILQQTGHNGHNNWTGIWVFGGVMLLAASGIFMVLRSWKFGFKLTTKA
ncbi:MFS general substrate transporter [Neurospora crassa]|uniref:MFS monocarboxylate transporter n=2 Tax=Neurospora crassa TaxID=5141 RepID=Q1K5P3_NEUCR|nr:MFS monocarboxylate transporter [Neurospora crassa OR74A]EAA27839.1 MFS monocarboxylate transporter [Neurospora crassa OR74A]KHE87960.1 MFS general substrate transporter [Neurospora crassa]CAD70416.1 related to monocarboxylate transporter [Neurospora crassa]|eukprot:XP_957075.1 MFS monocarboxylate transporter [Neurospora crassa OR74A]